MINTKLKKGKTSDLLIEFHKSDKSSIRVINNFYQLCKQESVKVSKSSNLLPNMMRFYSIEQKSKTELFSSLSQDNLKLQGALSKQFTKIQIKFIVLYINQDDFQVPSFQKLCDEQNNPHIILIRQTLQKNFFDLDFQVQNTLSQQQSLIYLCQLSAMIINCQYQGEIQVYDQRKDKMIRKGKQGELSQLEVVWKNILYQTPGLGKEKCKVITQNYLTYQDLIKDYDKGKQLKNLKVGRGTSSMKMGTNIADRIYKIFNSLNGSQSLY